MAEENREEIQPVRTKTTTRVSAAARTATLVGVFMVGGLMLAAMGIVAYQSFQNNAQFVQERTRVPLVTTEIEKGGQPAAAPILAVLGNGQLAVSYFDIERQSLKYITDSNGQWTGLEKKANQIGDLSGYPQREDFQESIGGASVFVELAEEGKKDGRLAFFNRDLLQIETGVYDSASGWQEKFYKINNFVEYRDFDQVSLFSRAIDAQKNTFSLNNELVPAIAYFDNINNQLVWGEWLENGWRLNTASWNDYKSDNPEELLAALGRGMFSMVMTDQNPMIVYYNENNQTLKIAR